MFVRTGINSRSSDRTRRDEYGLPPPPSFAHPNLPLRKERRNFDRSSDSEFLWGRYRSGSDTDLWRVETGGRQDKERRFVRPSNPRAHVELEEFHPHTWRRGLEGERTQGEWAPKCVGHSHVYRRSRARSVHLKTFTTPSRRLCPV